MSLTLQERFHRFLHEMDFRSQDQATSIYRIVIVLVAIVNVQIFQVSYLIAFYFQKFSICIYSILCASVICIFIIVPGGLPWWKRPLPKFARPKKQ